MNIMPLFVVAFVTGAAAVAAAPVVSTPARPAASSMPDKTVESPVDLRIARSPLVRELAALHRSLTSQLATLAAEGGDTGTAGREASDRRAAELKRSFWSDSLRIRAAHARQAGDIDGADALEAAARRLDARDSGPAPVMSPVKNKLGKAVGRRLP